jgi:hypothetical protein
LKKRGIAMTEKQMRRSPGLLLIVLGLALSVWICWPLPKYLTSAIPYTFSARPHERVAGMIQGDHLQYLYHLNLLRAAVDGQIPFFSNPNEFAGPYHSNIPYIYFPYAYLYLPFSYVSPAFGYNVPVLLSFVATMIAGYGLARAWGANCGGAVCAAIVLTLFPYRLNSLFGGHASGSSFFLFPMAWWGLEKNWQTGRTGWGLMAGFSLAALSILDVHFLLFFCLLLPFWALWKLLEENALGLPDATKGEPLRLSPAISWQGMVAAGFLAASAQFRQARKWDAPFIGEPFAGLLLFSLLAVIGVVFLMNVVLRWFGVKQESFKKRWLSWPWLSFLLLTGYFVADFVNRPALGPKFVIGSLSLFALFHLGFLARAIQKKHFSPGWIRIPWRRVFGLWPSVAGLIISLMYPLYLKFVVFPRTGVGGGRSLFEVRLFSVPFHKLFLRSPEEGSYVGWVLIVLILAGAVALILGKRNQSLSGPATAAERRRLWISLAVAGLGMILACGAMLGRIFPLYNLLYRFVPFLGYIRATGKYLILTATGGAIALAMILTFIERGNRVRAGRAWLPPAVALLLILDFGLISNTGVSVLPARSSIYEHVKAEAKGTPLLELPIWPGGSAFSSAYQYGTMLSGVPTINGYSPMIPRGYKENIADPLYPLNLGALGEDEFRLLRDLNVRFVTFREDFFPRQVSALPATHSLKKLLLNPNLEHVQSEERAHLLRLVEGEFRDVSDFSAPPLLSVSFYLPYDTLLHQVGEEREDSEASTGKAWYSNGTEGFLFFGPYLLLPPGEYAALFRVKVEAPPGTKQVGCLDVYAGKGSERLTEQPLNPADWPLPSAYRFVKIPFRVTEFHPVETRGHFDGVKDSAIALDYVMVQPHGPEEDLRLEAEDFFSQGGRLMKHNQATHGMCLTFHGTVYQWKAPPRRSSRFAATGAVHRSMRGGGQKRAHRGSSGAPDSRGLPFNSCHRRRPGRLPRQRGNHQRRRRRSLWRLLVPDRERTRSRGHHFLHFRVLFVSRRRSFP